MLATGSDGKEEASRLMTAALEALQRIAELESMLRDYKTAWPEIRDMLNDLVKAHEDADSGADIPLHIYKRARKLLNLPKPTAAN